MKDASRETLQAHTDLRSKVILEMLKEEKSVTQLASEHKIHYSQLLKWKKLVL